jgi:hypothetical protein
MTADRPLLKFTKFDGAAFNLARDLEGVGSTGWKSLNIANLPQVGFPSREEEAMFSSRDYVNTNYVCTIAIEYVMILGSQ